MFWAYILSSFFERESKQEVTKVVPLEKHCRKRPRISRPSTVNLFSPVDQDTYFCKQCRVTWDGSSWAVSSDSTVCHSVVFCCCCCCCFCFLLLFFCCCFCFCCCFFFVLFFCFCFFFLFFFLFFFFLFFLFWGVWGGVEGFVFVFFFVVFFCFFVVYFFRDCNPSLYQKTWQKSRNEESTSEMQGWKN